MIIRLYRILLKKCVNRWRFRVSSAGFTLIELLVVIAMISVMLAALVGLFSNLSRSYTTEEVKANAQQDLRAAGNLMIRDIRMAGFDRNGPATDPIDGNGAGIKEATATKIRFTLDSNMDGDIDDNNERITYIYDAPNMRVDQILGEGAGSPEQATLIDNVAIFTFSYFDEDGNPTATLTEIREIQLIMEVNPPAGQLGILTAPTVPTLNTRIQSRNLWF